MRRRFHVARETVVTEVLEVEAKNIDDAISLVDLQEARLLTTTEGEPRIINCWEKPTGISEHVQSE